MGWVVNVTPRPLYPQDRPGTLYVRGWVGPRAGLDRCGKCRPPPGFDPRTVQPVASRCTDWAIAVQQAYKKYVSKTWHNGNPEVWDKDSDPCPQSMALLVRQPPVRPCVLKWKAACRPGVHKLSKNLDPISKLQSTEERHEASPIPRTNNKQGCW